MRKVIDPKDIKTCKRCFEEKECPYGKYYCRACQALFCKEYKAKNKAKVSEYNKQYKSEHKEEVCDYNHKYNKENREAIQKRQTAQHKERRANDYHYKRSSQLRTKVHDFIKNDKLQKSRILNCSRKMFIEWLQSNFQKDMNLDNYGEVWCIDHVMPCSLFNFEEKEDDETRCFHWTNLRPLYMKENQKRQNRVTREEIENQEKRVEEFIKKNKEETIHLIHYDKFGYFKEQ